MTKRRGMVDNAFILLLLQAAGSCASVQQLESFAPNSYSDRSGRTYSDIQVLRMGLDKLEAKWNGRYWSPLQIMEEVLQRHTDGRLKRLRPQARRNVLSLERTLAGLDKAVSDCCVVESPGGTAIKYSVYRLSVSRRYFIWRVASNWPLSHRSRKSDRELAKQQIGLILLRVRQKRSGTPPPEFRVARTELPNLLPKLRRGATDLGLILRSLPGPVSRALGKRLCAENQMLQEWHVGVIGKPSRRGQ